MLHNSNNYIDIVIEELLEKISQKEIQGNLKIEFDNGFFKNEESYKYKVYEKARESLQIDKWSEDIIGNYFISDCVLNSIKKGDNLVSYQTLDFIKKIDENVYKAETIFYHMYKSNDLSNDEKWFNEFINYFGKNYNRIAYLFFLKDREQYLPIKSTLFRERFELININDECTRGCSWEHYIEFIEIIKYFQKRIQLYFSKNVSLLDAHSFVWCLHLLEKTDIDLEDDVIFQKAKERSSKPKRTYTKVVEVIQRDSYISEWSKRRAKGICCLCNTKAPFNDNFGKPYLESHHVIWLSEGGDDSMDNVVALCPNCHKKMHVLKGSQEEKKCREYLLSRLQDYIKIESNN